MTTILNLLAVPLLWGLATHIVAPPGMTFAAALRIWFLVWSMPMETRRFYQDHRIFEGGTNGPAA